MQWVQRITVFNTLLCPAIYTVKQFVASTLAVDIY